ncbi:MAG: primosomal protein N' (replication factor Y) [Mariniblastus sp.]|jgi:primosomal protein N' (replication factor Y)
MLLSMDQGSLFNVEPQPWQLDDHDDWLAARIVFSGAPYGPYDYSIPANLEKSVSPGVRIEVPLGRGNRKMQGYCVDVIGPFHALAASVNPRKLKPIDRVLDEHPLINSNLLGLANWISDYYLCPLGQVIDTIVPPAVRNNSGTREMLFLSLADGVAENLAAMKLSELQRKILNTILSSVQDWTPRELAETVGCTQGPISTLRKNGLIVTTSRRVQQKTHEIPREQRMSDLMLNPEQQTALDAIVTHIDNDTHRTFLMHGITGSGKTEVYIRAIQKVVEFGRQAIVLVPEISLTPQTRQRFRARFDRVAVLHSHLTAAQRAWHWQQIAAGNVQVIVGARSAIFAPTPNLGLIVLDEEHDGSFKQDKAPRYHARDVADWRASKENVPLILGSATPSLETWHRAGQGTYETLSLKKRVLDLPLPDVATIDLRVDFGGRKRFGPISQKLRQEISQAIKAGGQVILLLNRRGFSTRIQCPACGNVETCPDCSIPLTHHVEGKKACCHYCDHQIPEPKRCTQCNNPSIRFSGLGTQRLEATVAAMFPDVSMMRMDTDTMRKPGSHEKALAKFRSGETKLLLGTQMIAKGLDFPNVTLVGVINADTALHLPDFRAAERTFGLVTQVAGRTGRGEKGGRVLVQTFNPENKAIQAATRHDYLGFAATEMPEREEYNYPPFGFQARIVVRGEIQSKAEQMADHIADEIQSASEILASDVAVLGPAPAPVEKLRGKFRFHMLLSSGTPGELQNVIRRAQTTIKSIDDVQWIVDIDPQDMM